MNVRGEDSSLRITDKDIIIELLRQREELRDELLAKGKQTMQDQFRAALKPDNSEWRNIPDNPPKIREESACPELADSYNTMVKQYLEMRKERDDLKVSRYQLEKLEKENLDWRQMVDTLRQQVYDLGAERDKLKKELAEVTNQLFFYKNEGAKAREELTRQTIESSRPMPGYLPQPPQNQ